MPIQLKVRVYKTVIKPDLMYGSWAIKKRREQKMPTNKMKMLKWTAGVTRLDKVRNVYIRGSFCRKVGREPIEMVGTCHEAGPPSTRSKRLWLLQKEEG